MNRAFSFVNIKSMASQSDAVIVEGIASTPTPDKVGDVVVPTGARFALPLPLLLHHRHDQPVGHVTYAAPTGRGIPFSARIPRIKSPGKLKERVDEAIDSLQAGLIAAVSVGFSAIAGRVKSRPGGGSEYLEWSWHELSLCTIPMNGQAVIHTVKGMGPAEIAGPMSQDLIHRIKVANFGMLRKGVPLVSGTPRKGVKLLEVR